MIYRYLSISNKLIQHKLHNIIDRYLISQITFPKAGERDGGAAAQDPAAHGTGSQDVEHYTILQY